MKKIICFTIFIILIQACKNTSSNCDGISYKEDPLSVILFGNKGINNNKAAKMFNKGLCYIRHDEFANAKKEFLKANSIESNNIVILSALANIESELGNLNKSNRMFYKLIEKDSTYTNLYNNLAINLNLQEQHQEAKHILLQGLKYIYKENPHKKSAYFITLATTYKGLSDCKNILKFSKKALHFSQNEYMTNTAKKFISYAREDCTNK